LLNGDERVLVDDVSISTIGQSAFGIQALGASQFVVSDSMISTGGQFADGIQLLGTSRGSVVNTSIGTSGLDAHGINVGQSSFLNLQSSRIFTSGLSGAEGIFATDNAQLDVNGTVVTVTGPSTFGVLATPTLAADSLVMRLNNSVVNATSHGVVLGGAGFGAGTLDATVQNNAISSVTGSNEIDAQTNGAAVLNVRAQGNRLDPIAGTIRLNEIGGDLNVNQSAPGSGSGGIDAANGLPATNILVPGSAIDYDEPSPAIPTP
jgi:hypothetical protein